ncbi:aminoglycoside 3'-phosphotransferase [Phytoactinopolyspora mesophila]|uniref:aminoglycoside 3'-phosphotransferase n=1 Tax=Phytoactinopolyspora mesophila TaxID=2650750 RepID=UPI001C9E9D0D
MSRLPFSGRPTEPVTVPDVVRSFAADDAITPVWQNELGGLTFRLDDGRGGIRYIKWIAAGTPEIDLAAEAERLAWAQQWVRVPHIIEQGADTDGSWLVTTGVPGRSAVDPRWVADPKTAATAIGQGLRLLHDTLPVHRCPFDWSVQHRLDAARQRLHPGARLSDRLQPHRHPGGITDAETRIDQPPPIDRLVVCHGDACAPNTLLHDDGAFAAHVDLGALGVADRWADLAIAAWSTEWNYGPGYDTVVYEAYGIDPDPERIAYYRLLWDMT